MALTTLTCIIAYIVLLLLVVVIALFIGKQKYKQAHPKDVKSFQMTEKEDRSKQNIRSFGQNKTRDDDAYEKTPASLSSDQEIIRGPVIIVDEEKVSEWKPPSENKIRELAAEQDGNEKQERVTAGSSADQTQTPSEGEWTDEDLEIFEARSYSFEDDEKDETVTQAAKEDAWTEPRFKEYTPVKDPSEDEGVQVFETNDFKEKENKAPAEESAGQNSKFTYFDSVMEKEKVENAGQQQSDDAVIYDTKTVEKAKKNPSMQYIELDLENTDD